MPKEIYPVIFRDYVTFIPKHPAMALFPYMSNFQRYTALILISVLVLLLLLLFGEALVKGKLFITDGLLAAILLSCAGIYYFAFRPKKIQLKSYFVKSTAALFAANLVYLILALVLKWSLLDMLIGYLVENLVIGIYTLVKIPFGVNSTDFRLPSTFKKIISVFLFALHYFSFCLLFFLIIVYLFNPIRSGNHGMSQIMSFEPDWLVISASFFVALIRHAISFKTNFLDKKEFRGLTISAIMKSPYQKVLVVLIAVLCIGLLMRFMTAVSVFSMILFYLVKMMIEARQHIHEHKL